MLDFLRRIIKRKEAIEIEQKKPISLNLDEWVFESKHCFNNPYCLLEIDSLYETISLYNNRLRAMLIIIKQKGVLNNYVMQCDSEIKVKLNRWLIKDGYYISDPLDDYRVFKKLLSELKELCNNEEQPFNKRNINVVIKNADSLISVFNTIGEKNESNT